MQRRPRPIGGKRRASTTTGPEGVTADRLGHWSDARAIVLEPLPHLDALHRERASEWMPDGKASPAGSDGLSSTKRTARCAISTRSPGVSVASWTMRPLTRTPLRLSRSRTIEAARRRGQELGVTARQPRVAVADVAAGIAADRHRVANHQLALAAAIVEHQTTAHVVAPMLPHRPISSTTSACRRAEIVADLDERRCVGTARPQARRPPRSSSTG